MNSTTIAFPRSVHEKYLGIVQLARTIDKAKMVANGTIGEYHYNCPMDQALFAEFGIDGKKLAAVVADVVKDASHGPAIEAYVKPLVQKKSPLDIERFNRDTLAASRPGEPRGVRDAATKIAPDRTDVTTWPDLLDLDEGRSVPKRTGGANRQEGAERRPLFCGAVRLTQMLAGVVQDRTAIPAFGAYRIGRRLRAVGSPIRRTGTWLSRSA